MSFVAQNAAPQPGQELTSQLFRHHDLGKSWSYKMSTGQSVTIEFWAYPGGQAVTCTRKVYVVGNEGVPKCKDSIVISERGVALGG